MAYSGVIITKADYPSIRTKLGITIDDLSDDEIETINLLQVSESSLTQLVTDYATIIAGTGNNKVFLQAACVSLCAAYAVTNVMMKNSRSYHFAEYYETGIRVKWGDLQAELLLEAKKFLLKISTVAISKR